MYATEQDILDLYGQDELFLAFAREGAVNLEAVDRALKRATDEIDTYLAARYELPVDPVPTVLVQLCVDIALYKGSVGPAQTLEKRTRYDDAVKLLKEIAAGRARLNVPVADEPVSRDDVTVDAPDKLFSRDLLEKY